MAVTVFPYPSPAMFGVPKALLQLSGGSHLTNPRVGPTTRIPSARMGVRAATRIGRKELLKDSLALVASKEMLFYDSSRGGKESFSGYATCHKTLCSK